MSASAPNSHRWMYGPIPDLLIGCGGLYAVGFVLFYILREQAAAIHLGYLLPVALLIISVPHYGGTLARVYESREQRRKYAVFTVYATALLIAWFAVGTWNALVGSLMITLYLSWSPWHYSGQNYGIALMFLGRAGVSITPRVKTAFWLSFVLSFVLAILNMHANRAAPSYVTTLEQSTLRFMPLGVPQAIVQPVFAVAALVYAGCLAYVGYSLIRAGSLRAIVPAALIAFSQSLWFVIPYVATHLGGLGPASGAYTYLESVFIWVAIAHAAQYLWITSYYARASGEWNGFGRYFGQTMAFGAVAWTLPLLVFAPYALGGSTFAQGLALLVAALVNLHHFVLDGAIWKLRNSRIASILIRDDAEGDAAVAHDAASPRWGVHIAWAVALLCITIQATSSLVGDIALPVALERGATRTAELALDGGRFIGLDTARRRVEVGDLLVKDGRRDAAKAQYVLATELNPDAPGARMALGKMYVEDGQLAAGIGELRQVLENRPNYKPAQRQLDYALKLQAARGGRSAAGGS